jgi:hypothetical protein
VPYLDREIERLRQQIAILEPRLLEHLRTCPFCQRREPCDTRGGYECAIALHRRCITLANSPTMAP